MTNTYRDGVFSVPISLFLYLVEHFKMFLQKVFIQLSDCSHLSLVIFILSNVLFNGPQSERL